VKYRHSGINARWDDRSVREVLRPCIHFHEPRSQPWRFCRPKFHSLTTESTCWCCCTYSDGVTGSAIDHTLGTSTQLHRPAHYRSQRDGNLLSSLSIHVFLHYAAELLVRERSALATLIITSRVCRSFCHSVRNFEAKYIGNEAR